MNKLPSKIRKELLDFRSSQEKQISYYQSSKNNEMAYLVRWSILEKIVKTVTQEYRRNLLAVSLRDWLAYIEKGKSKPENTPKTALEAKVLPQRKEFIAALNYYELGGQDVWEVMDSNGKHRRHRNELAHTGKKFLNMLLYSMLFADMEKATNVVFEKIESNK